MQLLKRQQARREGRGVARVMLAQEGAKFAKSVYGRKSRDTMRNEHDTERTGLDQA
jgi:hypothetical protein